MALGARPSDVVRLIAGQGIRPVLWGLGAGLIAALAGARWISSLLYGVRPRDPLTLAAMSLVLLAVAAAAIVSPARRAARIDPLEALHQE
jgi:ABC-type antimicrobial peptide transport system permease subunit